VAIAATWVVNGTAITTAVAQIYTVPSTGYRRDLVVSNGTGASCYVGLSTDGTVATSLASFKVPAGGSVILSQCQVPAGAVLSALTGVGTSNVSVGYGSLVNFT
jgi:hypothetical protein